MSAAPVTTKRKTICNGCKFAAWSKTGAGNLHPSGYGKCNWAASYPIAASHNSYSIRHVDLHVTITGGSIERNTIARNPDYLSACPVREDDQ